MNPACFKIRPAIDVLSTLAHEMVHQEQDRFGKPSRRGYHNKEWAAMMKAIGLQPSDTGEPWGKETSERMSHTIVAGGAFEKACEEILNDGYSLAWTDRASADEAGGGATPRLKSKIKYSCPDCGLNVWGKPELHQQFSL